MPTYRNLALGLGVALAAASLTVGGTVASFASPTSPDTRSPAPAASAAPNPEARHAGTVAGLQTGPNISIRNPSSVRAFRVLHKGLLGKSSSPAAPQGIHENVGTSFDASTLGSQATQSVSTKIKPGDPGTTLYTPTMYPSGGSTAGSCIEMSTAYFHTSQVVAAWDWCKAINFVAQVTINRAFMKTYTQNGSYSTQITQTNASNNTWTSYLYNYKTNTWEKFFSQNGSSQVGLTVGWDIYELYTNIKGNGQSYACDDLAGKRIQAQNIMVGVNGTFVLADPTNAGHAYDHPLSEFDCKAMRYHIVTPYSHWRVLD